MDVRQWSKRAQKYASSFIQGLSALGTGIKQKALYEVPAYDRAALYWQAGTVVVGLAVLQWWPWVPGIAIGFLGVVAAIMAARGERATPPERFVWILISTALFVVEIRSILNDRTEFAAQQSELRTKEEKARTEERKAFAKVLEKTQALFDKTDAVQTLTTRNLKQITGGNSFGFVVAQTPLGNVIPLAIHNSGDAILNGVRVWIVRGTELPCNVVAEYNPNLGQSEVVGTLYPHQVQGMTAELFARPLHTCHSLDGSDIDVYFITISAQNGRVEERLEIKHSTTGAVWATRYEVQRNTTTFKNGKLQVRTDELINQGKWRDDY